MRVLWSDRQIALITCLKNLNVSGACLKDCQEVSRVVLTLQRSDVSTKSGICLVGAHFLCLKMCRVGEQRRGEGSEAFLERK